MASAPTSPDDWLGVKPVRVMCDALEQGRLSHSIVISAEDPATLNPAAHFLSARILAGKGGDGTGADIVLENHPDFFTLRPTGKMRQISADNTRELIRKIHHSPQAGQDKVAVIYEAERMHLSAANIFLKTLEEPPANTTILLLTSRPGYLLPTIRSRCLHFRLPRTEALFSLPESANAWLQSYEGWLRSLPEIDLRDKRAISGSILSLYGLVARFSGMLKDLTAEAWKEQKESAGDHLTEEELAAIEEGVKRGIRDRLFAAIERRTRDFACRMMADAAVDSEKSVRAFSDAIGQLERSAYLLRVNLNESTALEAFLLSSLRVWSRVRAG